MNVKFGWLIAAVVSLGLAAASPAAAQEFYKGKTIRFVVGFAAGGGYDLAARIVGRHIGKHIPGNPAIVVENMTGAGSLIAANYTYNSAKPDGLFVGIWNSAYVLRQAMGDKAVRLDARKLGWIGAPTKGTPFCSIMAHTGLKSLNDIVAAGRELKMGATGPGSTYDDMPQILNRTLGTKFKVISGYEQKGSGRRLLDLGVGADHRQTDARCPRRGQADPVRDSQSLPRCRGERSADNSGRHKGQGQPVRLQDLVRNL
jgi:tripartite-type tricarboxylate transporter receptor subunit TctC